MRWPPQLDVSQPLRSADEVVEVVRENDGFGAVSSAALVAFNALRRRARRVSSREAEQLRASRVEHYHASDSPAKACPRQPVAVVDVTF